MEYIPHQAGPLILDCKKSMGHFLEVTLAVLGCSDHYCCQTLRGLILAFVLKVVLPGKNWSHRMAHYAAVHAVGPFVGKYLRVVDHDYLLMAGVAGCHGDMGHSCHVSRNVGSSDRGALVVLPAQQESYT